MTDALKADDAFPFVASGGFQFENYHRNKMMLGDGKSGNLPKAHKTGTTIVGVVYKGGVVLGADTRATSNTVVDKNCQKIHYIAPNIYCCGAGTAADTEMTTGQISSQLELLRLNTGKSSRVVTAMTMLKRHLFGYQGHVSAALVLGGVDVNGPHLYTVYPHGSTDKLPFVTMGSGSLAAMSVFETLYRDNLTEAQAVDIVSKAILAGVYNDLGSGSNVDVCIIRSGEVEMKRNYMTPMDVAPLKARVKVPAAFGNYPKGTTKVVSSTEELLSHVSITSQEMELDS